MATGFNYISTSLQLKKKKNHQRPWDTELQILDLFPNVDSKKNYQIKTEFIFNKVVHKTNNLSCLQWIINHCYHI